MTTDELLAWGDTENAQRKADLATVNSQADLERVQAAAAKRRNAAGLSVGEAAHWVKEAQVRARATR